jgi:hypothetical protein
VRFDDIGSGGVDPIDHRATAGQAEHRRPRSYETTAARYGKRLQPNDRVAHATAKAVQNGELIL